jgi:DNA invertase Pin-like site-specific DNA recombinase
MLRVLEAVKVDLYLDQQAIDTTRPAGRMFFHITGAFAEFERDMIRSRVNAGLARAKARGVKLGRPKVSAKVEAVIKNAWRTAVAAGRCNGSRRSWLPALPRLSA